MRGNTMKGNYIIGELYASLNKVFLGGKWTSVFRLISAPTVYYTSKYQKRLYAYPLQLSNEKPIKLRFFCKKYYEGINSSFFKLNSYDKYEFISIS